MQREEIWVAVPIDRYAKHYSISTFGRVRSEVTRRGTVAGTIKASSPNLLGYVSVMLSLGGIDDRFLMHRLVALAFIPNPENKPRVNHMNGIRHDNALSNLEWVTAKENTQHAMRELGMNDKRPRGSRAHGAKLTEELVVTIRLRAAAGERLMDLASEHGINASTVSSVVSRRYWKHVP